MQGILYEEPSAWLFILVTVVLGGWAAWMTGRAMALNWRPYGLALAYLIMLTGAVRFFHYALFGGTLLSAQFFLVDFVVVALIGSAGFRFARAGQMSVQYRWLYHRTGPFTWRERVRG